jgi:hypothetical protein
LKVQSIKNDLGSQINRAIDAQDGERFQVGLQTGAATAIGAGHGQHLGWLEEAMFRAMAIA